MTNKCKNHRAHARCVDCGAEYNIPKGMVLVSEHDVKLLDAAARWAEKFKV